MLPKSDDRFDQKLAGWFSLRRGAWYGTAAQLLASVGKRSDSDDALWPQSPRALYAHLESHKRMLQSLGVDVSVLHGVPRMVSLRSCQNELLHPPSRMSSKSNLPRPQPTCPRPRCPARRPVGLHDPGLPANGAYQADIVAQPLEVVQDLRDRRRSGSGRGGGAPGARPPRSLSCHGCEVDVRRR